MKKWLDKYEDGGNLTNLGWLDKYSKEGTPSMAKDATQTVVPKSMPNPKNSEEYKYFHPEVWDISSGDKRQDILYRNQWLMGVPVLGNMIRDKAEEVATQSGANSSVMDIEENKRWYTEEDGRPYTGSFTEGGPNLVQQYFYGNSLEKSRYSPKSDYLSFLPSYSVKGDKDYKERLKFAIDQLAQVPNQYGIDSVETEKSYQKFLSTKNPIFKTYEGYSELMDATNTNLGGHKAGLAWDESVNLPYASLSDAWDFSPEHYVKKWGWSGADNLSKEDIQKKKVNDERTEIQASLLHKAGKPFKVYDRFYFDPKTKEYISDDSIESIRSKMDPKHTREQADKIAQDKYQQEKQTKYVEKFFSKMKNGGWLDKLDGGNEVKPAVNDAIPSSRALTTQALQQAEGATYNNWREEMMGKQPSYIRESEPDRSVLSSILAGISHPSTLLSYIAKGEGVPQHFDRGPENPLEYAIDYVNPAWYINSLASIPGNVVRGELGSAALNALSILPLASIAKPGYKAVVEAAGKGELYKMNPFAKGADEMMAYKALSDNRATGMLKGQPALNYSKIGKSENYLPVYNSEGAISHYVTKNKSGYSNLGSDVRFIKGKITPKRNPATKETSKLTLEVDPQKVSMIGAPTKAERLSFSPRDMGEFNPGKTVIPRGVLNDKELTLGQGTRILKLDPVRGYTPITPSETARMFATGKFTPDPSTLTEGILNFDKGLKKVKKAGHSVITAVEKGVEKGVEKVANLDPIVALNPKKLHALTERRNELSRLSQDAASNVRNIDNEVNNKLSKFDNLIRNNLSTNLGGSELDNKVWQANSRNRVYKTWVEGFTKAENTLVKKDVNSVLSDVTTSGKSNITHFRTNSKVAAEVQLPKTEKIFTKDPVSKSISTKSISNSDVVVSDAYIKTVRDNIAYIEEKTGAKVFGSARGVAEGGLPHIAHDYDVLISRAKYDKSIKDKLEFIKDNGPAKTHSLDKKFGQEGEIDFNIVEQTEKGLASGKRAEELFKQAYPSEYYKAARKAALKNKPIEIPYSPDKLLEEVNPTTKTILDAYESTKPKHINRIDSYISFGKPEAVLSAQKQYVKTLVGDKGGLGHQFDPIHFSDPSTNKALLKEIEFVGDIKSVSNDAQRMQVALNDFYISNTVLSRGAGTKIGDIRNMSAKELSETEASFKVWDPSKGGGQMRGSGLNHVAAGDSGHGPFYGNKQIGITTNIENPVKYVDSIKQQTSGFYPYTQDEQLAIQGILSRHGISGGDIIKDPGELISLTAYKDKAPQILKEVADLTGRKAVITTGYGDAKYASTLKDFDEQIDALEYALRDQMTIPKSAEMRRKALSPKQPLGIDVSTKNSFEIISSLLEDGIKKSDERIAGLRKQQRGLDTHYDEMRMKFTDRYKGLEPLRKKRKALQQQEYAYLKEQEALRKRLNRLEGIGDIIKVSAIAAGVSAAIIPGALYSLKSESVKRRREDSKKRAEQRFASKSVKESLQKDAKLQKLKEVVNFTGDKESMARGWLDKYQ